MRRTLKLVEKRREETVARKGWRDEVLLWEAGVCFLCFFKIGRAC